MKVQTYLFFDGRCEEAVEFYRKTIGAEVTMLMRFKDSPEKPSEGQRPPNSGDKVMHCSFKVADTEILASDGNCTGNPNLQGFSLALQVPSEPEAKRLFAALGDGGQVQVPMVKTFFSQSFGIVADRFGVSWMVLVDHP